MRVGIHRIIVTGVLCLVAIMVAAIAHQPFTWWVFPFVILFGTIFAGILALTFTSNNEDKFRRAAMVDHPNAPWMWDERWRSDIMMSRSKSEFWGTLTVAVILGVFALIGVASLLRGLPEGNLWVLLNVIPIAGAVYFGRNTHIALRNWRLEKQISLLSETRPAIVGARFSAVMETKTNHQAEQLDVWLEHIKVIRREESDGTVFEKVADHKLPGRADNIGHGKIRLTVDIPEKSPATSWTDDEQEQWWDLVVTTEIAGRKISLSYEIPVADPTRHRSSGT